MSVTQIKKKRSPHWSRVSILLRWPFGLVKLSPGNRDSLSTTTTPLCTCSQRGAHLDLWRENTHTPIEYTHMHTHAKLPTNPGLSLLSIVGCGCFLLVWLPADGYHWAVRDGLGPTHNHILSHKYTGTLVHTKRVLLLTKHMHSSHWMVLSLAQ